MKNTTPSVSTATASVAAIKLGLDVHAHQITFCRQFDDSTPQPAQQLPQVRFLRWLDQLRAEHPHAEIHSCYEAGPFGYHLHRELVARGVHNIVVAPQDWDERGKRVKTDRIDARALCERLDRYVRGNRHAFSTVHVPTPAQEQARALTRQRAQLAAERRRCEVRGRSLLTTQGIETPRQWWRPRAWAALAPTLPSWLREALSIWQKMAAAFEAEAETLRAKIEAAAPKALPKGVGALTWMHLLGEVIDWSRFRNRGQVASYTGLCPRIHASGSHCWEGSINRHGNRRLRAALVEAIWRLMRWQPEYPPLRPLLNGSATARQKRKVAVAAARRLAIDLWRIATGRCTPQQLGLTVVAG